MVAPAVVVTARMPFVAVSRPRMDASRARALRSNSGRIPRAGALRSRRRARASVPSAAAGDATSGGKTDGAGVAVVGIGTRGGVVVDRLLAQGVLPRAVFWSLNSDAVSLQSARAPNRWRLPPGNVDPVGDACQENAESAARGILSGGVAGEPPSVIVVVASAAEAAGAGMETVRAVARLKDGPPPRKWFNVGGRGRGLQHKGPLIITAALAPFDFEGPRKATSALAALEAAAGCSDFVACVAQEALTVDADGKALTVQEATDFADHTLQWSMWTVLEMLRSPAWVGAGGAGGAGNAAAWERWLSAETLRATVSGRPEGRETGCGVASVGHGAAKIELNFRVEEGQSAAIRQATASAAADSPFLRDEIFASAELVALSVQTGKELTDPAREAASDALSRVVGPDVPQIIVAAEPDPRSPPDAVEVTLLVVTRASSAYKPRGSTPRRENSNRRGLGLAFPAIPGMKPGPMVEAAASAAKVAEEERRAREEPVKKPAPKLTGEMLRKLGLSDPKIMVEQHDEGQRAIAGDDAVERTAPEREEGTSKAKLMEETAEAARTGTKPPPLPVPPPRPTTRAVPAAAKLPMPDPEDVAEKVPVPETRARPGEKPADVAPKPNEVDLARARLAAKAEAKAKAEAEKAAKAPRTVKAAAATTREETATEPKASTETESTSTSASASASASTTFTFDADRVSGNRSGVEPAASKEASVPSRDVSVPLPAEISRAQVAVRILELEEDLSGNVIGYRPISASDDEYDNDEVIFEDEDENASAPRRGGIFGWGKEEAEEPKGSKDAVKNRLASVLDKDRSGALREVVRMEFAGSSVYEGEWFAGKQEGEGKQVYAAGDEYQGRWREGLPDGRGKILYLRGGFFEGMFMGGKPNGPGVLDLTAAGGERVEGRWLDGQLKEEWGEQ